MSVESLLNVFKISNIIHWIIEIPSFILKPSKYVPIFFKKDREEKVLQTLFYFTISLLIEFLFINGLALSSLIKLWIIEFFLLLTPFITIYTTNFFIKRFSKSTATGAQILSFIIIYRSFASIFMILMQFLFIKTEHYIFYLSFNVCFICLAFFISFYSLRIFHERTRFIILGFIISYMILNISAIAIEKIISYDSFVDNIPSLLPEDQIYAEYEQTLDSVSEYVFFTPKARLSMKLKGKDAVSFLILDEHYVKNRFEALDTILELGNNHLHNLQVIDKRLKHFIPKLKFKRNKSIFMKLSNYTTQLINIHSKTYDDTMSVKCFSTYKIADKKNEEYAQARFYRLPKTIKNPLDSAFIEIDVLLNKTSSSEAVVQYGMMAIYYPCYLYQK